MAKINNQAVIQKLIDELGLYPVREQVPTELAEKILPVFQVNTENVTIQTPPATVVAAVEKSGNGGVTVYTVPSTGKFYLTNVAITNVAGTSTTGPKNSFVSVVLEGVTSKVINLMIEAGAAGTENNATSMNFHNPILLDAGSTIELVNGVSQVDSWASIVGYTTD